MGQRSVRFPEQAQADADAWAAANDRSFSYVVVKALEEFLARRSDPEMVSVPHRPSGHAQKTRELDAAKTFVAKAEASVDETYPGQAISASPLVVPSGFRCSVESCPRRFGSGEARCPEHGRKAVPV